MAMRRDLLARIGYSNIYTFLEDQSAYFFEAGMMIDADGAYRAYFYNDIYVLILFLQYRIIYLNPTTIEKEVGYVVSIQM